MKFRFFYGAATKNTWPKIFVLDEKGSFYCQYLDKLKLAIHNERQSINSFNPITYSWHGYQKIIEINAATAVQIKLQDQNNWVQEYCKQKDPDFELNDGLVMSNRNLIYLSDANYVDTIKLLVVGQDPYKFDANGIAFCKETFEMLTDPNCCGNKVISSLGYDLKNLAESGIAATTPVHLFHKLLRKGVAFINVSSTLLENSSNLTLEEDRIINENVLKKANNIVVLGETKATELFNEHYKKYEITESLIHPSNKNKEADRWKKIWNTNYLEKYINN